MGVYHSLLHDTYTTVIQVSFVPDPLSRYCGSHGVQPLLLWKEEGEDTEEEEEIIAC